MRRNRPRPRRSQPLPYCAAWDLHDRGLAARFSGSVETGRLWGGRPEQARVWIDNTLSRTLLLGFDKANLVQTGRATTGRLRPGRFLASVKPFFYDLSDSGHLKALKNTWHHLAAYAAGFQQHPHHPAYRPEMGQDRELCRTEYRNGKYEILVASCYNQNYHESDDPQLFAWDDDTRKAAWERYYQRYPVVPGFCFQIYRVEQDGTRIHEFERGDRYELPFSAAESLVKQAERVLRELWIYLQRNPSQILIRHDAFPQDNWIVRWQLYDPPPFNAFVGPELSYTFDFTPDHQRFAVTLPQQEVCPTLDRSLALAPVHPLEEPALPIRRESYGTSVAGPDVAPNPPIPSGSAPVYWMIQVLERLLGWLLSGSRVRQPAPKLFLIPLTKPESRPARSYDPPIPLARGPPKVRSPLASQSGEFFGS